MFLKVGCFWEKFEHCSLMTGRGYIGKCLCPDHILSLVSFLLLLLIFSNIKVTKEGQNDQSRKLNVTFQQITFG